MSLLAITIIITFNGHSYYIILIALHILMGLKSVQSSTLFVKWLSKLELHLTGWGSCLTNNWMTNKTNLSISMYLMGLYCLWSLLVNRCFSPTHPRIDNQIKKLKTFEKISKWSQWGAQLNGRSIYSPAVHLFGIFSCVYKNFMDISWISLAPRGKI